MATPSDELFPSIHFLTELGALLGRHGYEPRDVPVAHAVGQAIPELIAFLSAYLGAPAARAPRSDGAVMPFYVGVAGPSATAPPARSQDPGRLRGPNR